MAGRNHPLAFVALLLALAAPAARASWLSEKLEKFLGSYARAIIEMQLPVDRDPLLHAFLRSTADPLIAAGGRDNISYRLAVLDIEEVNALAAPAGYLWVTKGCLRFVDTPDELACVLGHEVAHITQRHGWRGLKRDLFLSSLLSAAAPNSGRLAGLLGFWRELDMLRHSRHQELDADRLGTDYAFRAGFDYSLALCFFAKLRAQYGDVSRLESYLATHPTFAERLQRLRSLPLFARPSPAQLVQLGDSFAQRRLFNIAAQHYLRALDLDPQNPRAHLHLALAASFLARHSLAREHLSRALELNRAAASLPPSELAQAQRIISMLCAAPENVAPPPSDDELSAARSALDRCAQLLASAAEQPPACSPALRRAADRSAQNLRAQALALSRAALPAACSASLAVEAIHRACAAEDSRAQTLARLAELTRLLQDALARKSCSLALVRLAQRLPLVAELTLSDLALAAEDSRRAFSLAGQSSALLDALPVAPGGVAYDRPSASSQSLAFRILTHASLARSRAALAALRVHEVEISANLLLANPLAARAPDEFLAHALRLPRAPFAAASAATSSPGELALIACAALQLSEPSDCLARRLSGQPTVADGLAQIPNARLENLHIVLRHLASLLRSEREAAQNLD